MNDIEAIPHRPESDAFDFKGSWDSVKQSILRHRLLIVFTCMVSLGFMITYFIYWPSTYQAEVVLAGDPEDDNTRDSFYQLWNVFRKDHLPDEAQLITAGVVLERVVEDLDLTYDDVFHPFLSHAAYLWTESWIGKQYRKIKKMILPPKKTIYDPTPEQIDHARTLHDFKKGVSLNSVPDTNIGLLIVRGPSPRVAQVANYLVKTYLHQRKMRHVQEAEDAYNSLKVEAEKVRNELLMHELVMEEYFTDNSILLMFEKDKVEIAQWIELETSIVENQSLIATLESTLAKVNDQLGKENKEITSVRVFQKNSLKETLKDRLSKLKLSLQQVKEKYRPNSPEVREVENQIAMVNQLIGKEGEVTEFQTTQVLSETYEGLRQRKSRLESELEGARAGLQMKIEASSKMRDLLQSIPTKMKTTKGLNREHQMLEKKYTVLQEKLMVAAVSRATALSAPPSLRVVDFAVPPEKPSFPNKKLFIALALLIGVFAGIGLALLIDLVYNPLSSNLLKTSSGLSIYATVTQDQEFIKHQFLFESQEEDDIDQDLDLPETGKDRPVEEVSS